MTLIVAVARVIRETESDGKPDVTRLQAGHFRSICKGLLFNVCLWIPSKPKLQQLFNTVFDL